MMTIMKLMIGYAITALLVLTPVTDLRAQAERGASGAISARDMIEIRVFREEDLATRAQLSPAGTVTMPLIGAVRLAGLDTDAAAKLIEARLKDGYLVKPQVSVSIAERVRRSVTVLGQVRDPGVFRLTADRPLMLVEAVGMAGGMTRIANAKKVTLKRGDGSPPQVINVKDITTGKTADVVLRDGDVINVPEGWF
jgi:protein involved in polysaccharide export with SLBB domain